MCEGGGESDRELPLLAEQIHSLNAISNTSAVQLYQMWSSCRSHPHPNPRTISLPARANSPSKQCLRSYSHLTATSTLIAFTNFVPRVIVVASLQLNQLTSTSLRWFSAQLLCWCTTWCCQNLRMPFLVAKTIIFTEQIASCTEYNYRNQ